MLTLAVDDRSQAAWDELRERWFPPGRLVVGAHLTLFHALPGSREDDVVADVRSATAIPPFPLHVDGLRFLGRGVALRVHAPRLDRLHDRLRRRWRPWLTPQDNQPLSAHVTVQNKVPPEQARRTLALLEEAFEPWEAIATGVDVWHYEGGPWSFRTTVPFHPRV